jgi:hypothetical protein
MPRGPKPRRRRRGTFNPDDASIEHQKIGVWDLYVQHDPLRMAWLGWFGRWQRFEDRAEALNDLKYLWRAMYDLRGVCSQLFVWYTITTIAVAIVPAVSLW